MPLSATSSRCSELCADRIGDTSGDIDQVVAELAVAVGIAVIKDAVRMARGSFVDRADGGVPAFPERPGVGQDAQDAMLQFKVRVAQDVRVGIAGHGIEPEV